jgi:DNA-binding phage protein
VAIETGHDEILRRRDRRRRAQPTQRKACKGIEALGETGNPEFGTVMRIVRALGLTLSARPATAGPTSKRRRVA